MSNQSECTRVTPTSETLIDLILTNRTDLFDSTGVIDFGLSDHAMVYGFIKHKVKKYRYKIITFRSKKNFDEKEFKHNIQETITNMNLQNINSVDDQHNTWYIGMSKVMDSHMPLKKMRVRERDVPYITREWKEAIRKKRKFAKKHRKLKTEESFQQMKHWRNESTRLRRRAIKNYWREKATDLKDNPRSFYKTFLPFMNDKTKDKGDIILKTGNNMTQDQHQVANILVDYFSTIADV